MAKKKGSKEGLVSQAEDKMLHVVYTLWAVRKLLSKAGFEGGTAGEKDSMARLVELVSDAECCLEPAGIVLFPENDAREDAEEPA